MPLLVPCEDIQPGMRLSEAFLWRRRMMLPAGKVLTDHDVGVLRERYPKISLRVADPVLDAMTAFEDDTREREAAGAVRQQVAAAVAAGQERFAAHTSLSGVNFNDARATVQDVIDALGRAPVSAALLDFGGDPANALAEHAGAAFYLTMALAVSARDYLIKERQRQTSASRLSSDVAGNLVPLGLGAMFMDVGMYPLVRLFADGYELTDADRAAVRDHPTAGADLLPDTLPSGVKMIVRSHHENFDGTGYPKATAGASLHVFTRVVRVCDAFAAATAKRGYRGAKSPARAMWEITAGPTRGCYDPVLARALAGLIQPFPVGAKVTLADGRRAVVVRYNRKEPLRPFVIIAFDAAGDPLPKAQLVGPVPAGADPGTRLAAFAGEDLSYLYSLPEPTPPAATGEGQKAPREIAGVLEAAYP